MFSAAIVPFGAGARVLRRGALVSSVGSLVGGAGGFVGGFCWGWSYGGSGTEGGRLAPSTGDGTTVASPSGLAFERSVWSTAVKGTDSMVY
eukprot:826888-Prymnesium_polylepis.1